MNYEEARNLRAIMIGEADWLHRYTITAATTGNSEEFACYILDDRYNTLYVVRSIQEWRKDKEAIHTNLTEVSVVAA